MATVRQIYSSPGIYLVWALVSSLGLAAAALVDPYAFGFTAFGAALVSALLVVGAAAVSWRSLPWALLAALPSATAMAILAGYRWT